MIKKNLFARGVCVKGKSIADLRDLAISMRNSLHLEFTPKFPVIRFLEFLQWKFDDFELEIVPPGTLPKGVFACYNPSSGFVTICDTYYNMANEGNGFARWTILHECAHYILHKNQIAALYRQNNRSHQIYEDSEWQADTLVCELLLPLTLINKNMSVEDVAEIFGVSKQAAKNRLNKIYGICGGGTIRRNA